MSPFSYFSEVWARTDLLLSIHAYVDAKGTAVLSPSEILRAAWVNRVSALDLYIHELVAQRLLDVFMGRCVGGTAFDSFKMPARVTMNAVNASNPVEMRAIFDLEIRKQLSLLTFQDPEKIADGAV